jgi:hypothetical protein
MSAFLGSLTGKSVLSLDNALPSGKHTGLVFEESGQGVYTAHPLE